MRVTLALGQQDISTSGDFTIFLYVITARLVNLKVTGEYTARVRSAAVSLAYERAVTDD